MSTEFINVRDRRYNILVSQHDQVLNERLACIRGERAIVFKEQCREMGREFGCFLGVTLRDLFQNLVSK